MATSSLSSSLFSLWNKLQEKSAFVESPTPQFVLPKLTQLNDMVYRAYQPPPEENVELEIVFFHGTQFQDCEQQPYATTWMTRDNSECWLQTLLVEAFPKARIFTVSYDSSATKTRESGRMGIYQTGENLLSDLTADAVGLGQAGCPVVLVGHCLGGLVLKEMCLLAESACRRKTGKPRAQRAHAFFSNLKGMFFYGTPHTGSMVGDMLHDCFKSVGALSEEIETLKASSSLRNECFMDLKSENKWLTFGIGESRETYLTRCLIARFVWGPHASLLSLSSVTTTYLMQPCIGKYIHMGSEASTRAYMDGYYTVPGDHYEICKPDGEQDSAFQRLCEFLRKIRGDGSLQRSADVNAALDYYVDKQRRSQNVQVMLAQPETYAIFILGLSGSGKTALAQQVFHEIRNHYEVSCFVSLERIETTSSARQDTLRKIGEELGEADRGSRGNLSSIIRHFRQRKGLLVLDNVESQAQLDALCVQTWLQSSSSKLIVTTTNPSSIATTIPWVRSPLNTFEVPYLSYQESRDLFSHYAFGNGYGPEDLAECIEQVIVKCDRYPLFLKVLGACISKREFCDKQLWLDLVARLEVAEEVNAGHDEKLWAKLRLCYDGLPASEKEIFLDISTTLHGYPLPLLRCIWKDCRRTSHLALQNLQEQFLVFKDELGHIRMHQHLRNLGKSIACPEHIAIDKWQRISEISTASELINYHEGRVETLALQLHLLENEFLTLRSKSFEHFIRLQYLILKDVSLQGVTLELPRSLVYLRWENGLFGVCPVDFTHLDNLAVLEFIDCKLMKSLPPDVAKSRKLTWLELKGCSLLTELPAQLSDCLEHLGLNGTGLRRLPGDVGKLKRLRCLDAAYTPLKRVSRRLCGLEMLRKLDLRGTELTNLPENFGDLRMLEKLNLCGTQVTSLPEGFGDLRKLEKLNLCGTQVTSLPESFGDLRNLEELDLRETKLCSLPESIGQLQNLGRLLLSGTPLEKLPDSICGLHSLRTLDLYNTRLTTLPSNIGALVGLMELWILSTEWNGCPQSFRNLAGVRLVYMQVYPLEWVDSEGGDSRGEQAVDQRDRQPRLGEDPFLTLFGAFEGTRFLALNGRGCPQSFLPSLFSALQHMPLLTDLFLHGFYLPEIIPPDLGKLIRLSLLHLQGWNKLRELPECLGELPMLKELVLDDLPRLWKLPESASALPSSSTTLYHAPPFRLQLDWVSTYSWSIVERFLECCGKHHAELIWYDVSSEQFDKARMMATDNGPPGESGSGARYVLDGKVARELFPEMGASLCGRNRLRACTPAPCHSLGAQNQRLVLFCSMDTIEVVDGQSEHDGNEWSGEPTDEDSEDDDCSD